MTFRPGLKSVCPVNWSSCHRPVLAHLHLCLRPAASGLRRTALPGGPRLLPHLAPKAGLHPSQGSVPVWGHHRTNTPAGTQAEPDAWPWICAVGREQRGTRSLGTPRNFHSHGTIATSYRCGNARCPHTSLSFLSRKEFRWDLYPCDTSGLAVTPPHTLRSNRRRRLPPGPPGSFTLRAVLLLGSSSGHLCLPSLLAVTLNSSPAPEPEGARPSSGFPVVGAPVSLTSCLHLFIFIDVFIAFIVR